MHHPRRPTMPPAALLLRRWWCAWLALLMLTQLLAATLAGVHGAWHRHRPPQAAAPAPSTVVVHWRHGDTTVSIELDAHARLHADGEAHDHAASDASVLPLGTDAASEAVAQLAAALAPGADLRITHPDARHVLGAGASWAPTTCVIVPPLQPPRG